MKKILSTLMIIAALYSCDSNNNIYDSLPQPISSFISTYWPNPSIASYTQPSSGKYEVTIKYGPTLDFDSNYRWTEIDGNGMPLPEMLLSDQLPEKLYDYLEGAAYLNDVFEIERDSKTYTVELNLDITLVYDIATKTIRGVQ